VASFKLGIDAGDYLIVEINGRVDEHDDWLDATISLRAGAFSATFDACLVTSDFPQFRARLETLFDRLIGSAVFDTIEGQLKITCVGNGHGGVAVDVVAQDRAGDGNELKFRLAIDQTFLPGVIADLRNIEFLYPNRTPRVSPE